MFDSPTPIRSSLTATTCGGVASPSCLEQDEDARTTTATKRIFSPFKEGEENQRPKHQPNMIASSSSSASPTLARAKQLHNKKPKIEMKKPPASFNDGNGNEEDTTSDCGTEVSVAARRAWLQQFEQKHQANPFRKLERQQQQKKQSRDDECKVQPPKTPERQTSASSLVKRLVMSSPHRQETSTYRAFSQTHTHRRDGRSADVASVEPSYRPSSRPQNQTHDVTKDINNNVIQQSAGNSHAATYAKPFRTPSRFRKHEQVMATNEGYASVKELSQWLAADPTSTKKKKQVRRGRNIIMKSRTFENANDIVMIENNITKGAVKDRQQWLSKAFHKNQEQHECGSIVSSASRYYQRSDIASGYSRMAVPSSAKTKSYAQTDIVCTGRDAASLAKMRFKERSARKLMSEKSPIGTASKKSQT